MSSTYSRQYNSSRYSKKKESVRSTQRLKYPECKIRDMESRTPPLPTKTNSTLEELLKKRESLKQELKRIGNHSNNEERMKLKRTSDVYGSDLKIRRTHKNNDYKSSNKSKRKYVHESSPELDNMQIESEDEESIIQQRRQKRKQLLEALEISSDKSIYREDNLHKKDTEHKSTKITDDEIITKKVTDMFSEKDEFSTKANTDHVTQGDCETNLNLTDNWDDQEGYYNIRVGDIINNKYTIKGILGQGVFANVVRAQDIGDGNDYFAIKIVRNNDLMYKTSLKEIAILKKIREADPENKYHCVKFIGNFMHKGHLCILLESLHMDLRGIIKKYGKHHGISMKALTSYSRQLLLAMKLLKKLGIIHADIKPDNILVNEKKNLLKLCDFGSATKIDDNEPTPYLVSRFYRAPEIILGVSYKHSVDIWSAACTFYEMATGKILFTGNSNNKMLKCFMDLKGKFSTKLIKKGKFKDQHFNYNNNFLLHKKDEFTGREKVVELSNIKPSRDLHYELKKSYKNIPDKDEKKLAQLKDLIEKMTILDFNQRISVSDCLKHPFIYEDFVKAFNKN